jgi:hypothetical protein
MIAHELVTLQGWMYKFSATLLLSDFHRILDGPFGLAKAIPDSPALFGVLTRPGSLL